MSMVDATPLKSEAGEPPKAMTLSDLGKKIKSDHEALTTSIRYIVDRAISIGEDLNKAKAQVGHGSFLKWVKLNCAMSDKTAERYMKLATNKAVLMTKLAEAAANADDNFEIISNLSLAQAERLISGNAKGGGGGNPSDDYDRAEKSLIKKLEKLSPDVVEAAANETISRLQSAITAMKRSTRAAA
jgi:Protein of unknown function (DUF3102)